MEVVRQKNNIKTVWDVGGHFGYTSLVFANILGKCTNVYSFEPNKYNLERFKRNLDLNPHLSKKIHIVPLAISNIQGQEAFSISKNVDGSQSSGSHLAKASKPLHQSVYDKFHFSDTLVEVSTWDLLAESYPEPDLVKIDVEGSELFVLEGGMNFLSKHSPILMMEIHNISIMHEMVHLLRDLNYRSKLIKTEDTSLSRCFILAKRNP
jgi:FkbM family methyltransferase